MFCNKFQSVEEPKFFSSRNKFGSRSQSSKKSQWVGETSNSYSRPDRKKFQSGSEYLNNNNLPMEALKISDDDDEEFNGDMVEVDRFDDDEDSDDGKACGFFDDDECEICLGKKGSDCTHYEYNKEWKTYNLIVCTICQSRGEHWQRNCPNLKKFMPRPLSDRDPRAYAALLRLVSR